MSRSVRIAASTVVAILLAGAGAARGDATLVRDAAGRAVAIADASRIVSVGGAVTEILYALGLENRVIAVDTTSQFPERALREKPNVGYMRQLSPEGVLGLNPSLILAAEGSGPKDTVAVLETAHVPFVLVPDHFTGEGIIEKIRLIAAATGATARGECLARAVDADLAALARVRERIPRRDRVLFVLSFANDRPMVSGRNTAADGIIRLAGAENAITTYEGYKLVNDEAIVAAEPDAILVMDRAAHRLDAETVLRHPALVSTPAAARGKFVSMNGLYLLGFGPRTARAARDLAAALYSGLDAGALPSERGAVSDEACHQ
jgi:iron complex transport system substrate-binding protein